MGYDHTQKGLLHGLLIALAVLFVAMAPTAHAEEPWAGALLVGMAILFIALAACFAHLRVRDAGDTLEVAFGPLHVFRRRVRYDEIVSAREGRSILLDGWGIHFVPGRGWTWNIHGFAAVELELTRGRRLRIGTDDGARLVAHLKARAGLAEVRTTT